MTRKDYINIAAAILATQIRIEGDFERRREVAEGSVQRLSELQHDEKTQLRGVRRTATQLAEFLADDNPHFSKTIFLCNCGYGSDGQIDPEVQRLAGQQNAVEHRATVDRRFTDIRG